MRGSQHCEEVLGVDAHLKLYVLLSYKNGCQQAAKEESIVTRRTLSCIGMYLPARREGSPCYLSPRVSLRLSDSLSLSFIGSSPERFRRGRREPQNDQRTIAKVHLGRDDVRLALHSCNVSCTFNRLEFLILLSSDHHWHKIQSPVVSPSSFKYTSEDSAQSKGISGGGEKQFPRMQISAVCSSLQLLVLLQNNLRTHRLRRLLFAAHCQAQV